MKIKFDSCINLTKYVLYEGSPIMKYHYERLQIRQFPINHLSRKRINFNILGPKMLSPFSLPSSLAMNATPGQLCFYPRLRTRVGITSRTAESIEKENRGGNSTRDCPCLCVDGRHKSISDIGNGPMLRGSNGFPFSLNQGHKKFYHDTNSPQLLNQIHYSFQSDI